MTTPRSISQLIDTLVADNPDATAFHYRGDSLDYAGLDARARRLAGFLASRGVAPGDRVAFWLPSVPAYLVLFLACTRLGAIAVAVNTRYRAAEVSDILQRSRAKVLALWPGFRDIDFTAILDGVDPSLLSAIDTVLVYDEDSQPPRTIGHLSDRTTVSFAEAEACPPFQEDFGGPDAPCNIFTTSGTTSCPKLVLHRQFAIAHHAVEVVRGFGLDRPDTVTLQALPFCGVFGFCQLMAGLASGRPMVMLAAFDASEAVRLCARYRVTQFNATDDMVDRMLAATPNDDPFAALDFVGYAAFNRELDDLPARAETRGVRMVGLWGMSEMQALVSRRDADAPLPERRKAGGRLVSPDAQARVRDPESNRLLPPGEAGMLEIRGPSRMVEYLDNPDATAETITDDGYVRTGDLAMLEEDGGFEFLARMGDTLRLGGFLVAPAEIESEVMELPGVTAAQVVEASDAGRTRPVAFVTLDAGAVLNEPAALARCAERLANFKRPARIVAVDAFPVTDSANGKKIQRAKLRDMAQDLLTSARL